MQTYLPGQYDGSGCMEKIISMNFVILLNARSYRISSGVLVYNLYLPQKNELCLAEDPAETGNRK